MANYKKDNIIYSFQEILQDTFYFTILLKMKRLFKNIESKNYFTKFLMLISVTYIDEVSIFLDNANILSKDKFYKTGINAKIQSLRNQIHQKTYSSKKMKKKLEAMGINFNERVFDINVLVRYNKLYDFNFEEFNEEFDLKFWNDIFELNNIIANTIFNTMGLDNNLLKKLYSSIEEKIVNIVMDCDKIFNFKRYSYSVNKLFEESKELSDSDKVFILYRYRLVDSILNISKIFQNNPLEVEISSPVFPIKINIINFFRKYTALIVEIIGNDLKQPNNPFLKDIQYNLDKNIKEKNFYSLNRSMRNNTHYSVINKFSAEEIEIIAKNQKVYLKTLKKKFDSCLNVQISEDDILFTNFCRYCKRKGLNNSFIKSNYEKLYLEYYYTGKIII